MAEHTVSCPYCGEPIDIEVDEGGGGSQQYIEDCQVCCRPISIRAVVDEDGAPSVEANRLDD